MPLEPTPRLGLTKPDIGVFNWNEDWWENVDLIDSHPGIFTCTSTSLPAEPWLGQLVFADDIKSFLLWDGASWINQSSSTFALVQAGTGSIGGGKVIYMGEDSFAHQAQNTMEEEYAFKVLGLTLKPIPEGGFGLVRRAGLLSNPEWQLNPGAVYYLESEGNITDEKPEEGFIQIIGVAEGPRALAIRISSPFVSPESVPCSNSRRITISEEPPPDPKLNDLWFDIS